MNIEKLLDQANPPTSQRWYRMTQSVRNWTLFALVDHLAVVVQCIQEQPYTALQLAFDAGGVGEDTFLGNGFSKVCWPDKYDAEKGMQIARMRAVRAIVRELREHGVDYDVLVAKWDHYMQAAKLLRLNAIAEAVAKAALEDAEGDVDPAEEGGGGLGVLLVRTTG